MTENAAGGISGLADPISNWATCHQMQQNGWNGFGAAVRCSRADLDCYGQPTDKSVCREAG